MNRPTQSPIESLLARVPLFSSLDSRGIAEVVRNCAVKSAAAESEIVAAGEPADRFYVILSGRVKIYQLSPRGDEQILHLYTGGATFGEAAMFAGSRYPAFAQAVADSRLLVVTRVMLRDMIAHRPEVALAMLAGLSAKLREFARLIERISLMEVPARLAQVLMDIAREQKSRTITLRQTKRELAAQIGTIPETLSRAFAKMRADGLIEVAGKKIKILDAERLEDLAHS